MTFAEQISERYLIGFEIFKKLFQLNSSELRLKLKDICGDKIRNEYLINEGDVKKTTSNDEPWNITVQFHDELSINATGITFLPENQDKFYVIALFDKHFKLD